MLDLAPLGLYNPDMTAERIKQLRESLGWSKSELARRLGTTYVSVYQWERGTYPPSPVFRRMLESLEQWRDGREQPAEIDHA